MEYALTPILEMRQITKKFGNVIANDSISISVKKGSIHAIIGENGAGKTTLMNILYGLYNPDSGAILINGKPVIIKNPSDAIKKSIGMIHQHFKLIPIFTVTQNIALGSETRKSLIFVNEKSEEEHVRELSERYGLEINPRAFVSALPVSVQQRVEILKALYREAEVLILDEPTSLLTPQEIKEFFEILKVLQNQDKTIIFISHKLEEVLEISDEITVLRGGKVIGTLARKDATEQILANMMVGREVLFRPYKPSVVVGKPILQVQNLWGKDRFGKVIFKNISFEVREGEILGIIGVAGNGQTELALALAGIFPESSGKIFLDGKKISNLKNRSLRDLGIGYIPEDRQKEGLVLGFSVEENSFLGQHYNKPFSRNGLLDSDNIGTHAEKLVEEYDIRPPDAKLLAKNLSGGNQQKVILAREISRDTRLIIASQPTRGLDIGATEFVHSELIKARDEHRGVLLFSLSIEEVLLICTRIAVIYRGEIVGILDAYRTNEMEIGLLMLRGKENNVA